MRPVLWIPEIHVTKVVTDFLGGGGFFQRNYASSGKGHLQDRETPGKRIS